MSAEVKSSESKAAEQQPLTSITFEVWEPAQPPLAPTKPWPFIPLADPDEALLHLQRADEIVIPAPSIQLVVDYPLSRAFEFKLTAPGPEGFTRRALAQQIAALYARIYREEDETATRPVTETGCLNRGQSFGRYGIRMHDIDDLLLHTVSRRADGKYTLGIDS